MMPRSYVVPAVLQTVVLSTCALVVWHHLLSNAFNHASKSELWKNITTTFEGAVNASAQAHFNGTANNLTLKNGTILNGTAAINATLNSDASSTSEPFYSRRFPREIFLLVVVSPLYFYWHIWLERILPGRPRVAALMPAGEKSGFGEEDKHEEDIVQRWIAEGKVKRASLSWWNTFLKWILNLTIGTLWIQSLRFLLTEITRGRSPIKVFKMMLGFVSSATSMNFNSANTYQGIPFRFASSFLDIRPLASLIAFIVVPAHQRMTFEAGAGLVWDLFFSVFVSVVLSWIARAPWAQRAVESWMEAMKNTTAAGGNGMPGSQFPRIGDEL
jgi:hypothetical protein